LIRVLIGYDRISPASQGFNTFRKKMLTLTLDGKPENAMVEVTEKLVNGGTVPPENLRALKCSG
jgi:hypothetical protein